jgi:hypothetical protein
MNTKTNTANWRGLLKRAPEFGLVVAIALTVLGQLSGSNPVKAVSGRENDQSAAKRANMQKFLAAADAHPEATARFLAAGRALQEQWAREDAPTSRGLGGGDPAPRPESPDKQAFL